MFAPFALKKLGFRKSAQRAESVISSVIRCVRTVGSHLGLFVPRLEQRKGCAVIPFSSEKCGYLAFGVGSSSIIFTLSCFISEVIAGGPVLLAPLTTYKSFFLEHILEVTV